MCIRHAKRRRSIKYQVKTSLISGKHVLMNKILCIKKPASRVFSQFSAKQVLKSGLIMEHFQVWGSKLVKMQHKSCNHHESRFWTIKFLGFSDTKISNFKENWGCNCVKTNLICFFFAIQI
jgi:hypothetical protein